MTPCKLGRRRPPGARGYARSKHKGRSVGEHRLVLADKMGLTYEEFEATGLQVRHMCHNAGCVNPDHLEPGTAAQNNDDKMRAGRHVRALKVSDQQVCEIRDLSAKRTPHKLIAESYGISIWTVRGITRKKHQTRQLPEPGEHGEPEDIY